MINSLINFTFHFILQFFKIIIFENSYFFIFFIDFIGFNILNTFHHYCSKFRFFLKFRNINNSLKKHLLIINFLQFLKFSIFIFFEFKFLLKNQIKAILSLCLFLIFLLIIFCFFLILKMLNFQLNEINRIVFDINRLLKLF